MHRYETHVAWKRNGAKFTDMRYSRGHEWSFDGGVRLTASSAPSSIPVSYSVSEAVDPEEAPVAAASSCHMLTFRYLAAKRGFVIESYVDDAPGVLDKNPGKLAITRITFRPRIEFSGDKTPSPAELEALHRVRPTKTSISPARSSPRSWLMPVEPQRRWLLIVYAGRS